MTMTTQIAILSPVPLMPLFECGRKLLGADDSVTWRDSEHYAKDGSRTVGNDLGQGLPGIWDIDYRPDGPLRVETHWCEWDDEAGREKCAPEGETWCRRNAGVACALQASIDTAYGYKEPNGAGCGDLHAWFVTEVAQWCRERGSEVRWWAGEVCESDEYESVSNIAKLGDAEVGRPGSTVQRDGGMRDHEAFGAIVQRLIQAGGLT